MKRYLIPILVFILFGACDTERPKPPKPKPVEKIIKIPPKIDKTEPKVISLIDTAYYKKEEFLGHEIEVPRPTAEIKQELLNLIKSHPHTAILYKKLSEVEIKLGQFKEAEEHFVKYADLGNRDETSLRELACFYHNRLMYPKEIQALDGLAGKIKDKTKAKDTYQQIIELIKNHLLDVDKYGYINKIIDLFPNDPTYFKGFINELMADKKYKLALERLLTFSLKFPLEKQYFLKTKSDCLINLESEKEAEATYEKASIEPIREQAILNDYFSLLQRLNKLEKIKKSLSKRCGTTDDMTKLFFLHLYQNQHSEAERLLDLWVEKKKPKEIQELQAIAELYLTINQSTKATRYFWTLYYLDQKPEYLYKLFKAISEGKRTVLGIITPHTLSSYLSLSRFDANPSSYGGLVSLLLNDSKYYQRLEDLDAVVTPYFNQLKLNEIFETFKRNFPKSNYLPEIHTQIINEIYSYGEYRLAISQCQEFIKKYPKADNFFEVYLKMADCFSSLSEAEAEYRTYQEILDIANSRNNLSLYVEVFNRWINTLTSHKKYLEVISLYWSEIQKHPNNEKLYLDFLQFTESHNLYDEELKIYEKAIRHFNDTGWYHKVARWYIRHKGRAEFRNFTEQTKDLFKDTELIQYLQNFVHYRYPVQVSESQLYHQLYLYAHNKFPKNLDFVKGLLQFYSYFSLWDDFCTLSEEYYLYDEGIRMNYITYLSRKNLLRERLLNIKDKEGLSYLRFRADANSWLSFHSEALEGYQKLSKYYPGEIELNSKLAELYRSLDFCFEYAKIDFTYKSAEIYLHLTKIYPHQLEFYEKAGEVYAEVGRFNKASEIWDTMVCVKRSDENIYLNVATLYWDYYQFQKAVDVFKQVREIKGNPLLYSSQLAAVYECLKDYPAAIDEYITNIAIDRWGSYNQKQRLRFLAQNKNLTGIIKKRFERAIKLKDKEYEVVFAYADFLSNIGLPDEAKRLYRRTYNRYKNLDFLNELDNYFTEIKDTEYQEKVLRQGIQVSNQDPYYFRQLANFYEANKEYAKAKDVYLGLLTSIKDNEEERELYIELLLEVSNYLDRIKDFDGSLRLLEEASQLTKGQQRENLRGQLAQKLIAQNQFKKAGEILHALIKEHPTNTYYFNTLSQIYTKLNDMDGLANLYKEAIETIKKAKLEKEEREAKIIELRFGLINAYTKVSKFISAQDQYIEILNRKPLNEDYVISAYQFSKEHKLRERILKFYQKTSNQAFKDYRWNVLLATFYLEDRGYDPATKELEKALVNEPQRLELYHKLVDLYLKLELYDKAVVTYKQIYTLDDYNSNWLIKIGELYNRLGKRQKAVEAVHKLIEGNPPQFGKYFKLAEVYEGWGMLDEAGKTLESGLKKLKLNPYKQVFEYNDIDTLIRVNLKAGRIKELFSTLGELEELFQKEVNKQPNFERYKVETGVSSIRQAWQSKFPEYLAKYGSDDDYKLINELALASSKYQEFIQFASSAKLPNLEESLRKKLVEERRNCEYWEHRDAVNQLCKFYDLRKLYEKEIAFLNEEQKFDRYHLELARLYSLMGDREKELAELEGFYNENFHYPSFRDDFNSFYADIERYFTLLFALKKDARIEELTSKYNRYTGQFLNFLVRNGQLKLAIKTIDDGTSGESKVWKDTKKAFIYLHFNNTSEEAEKLFVTFLRLNPMGSEVGYKIDRGIELIDEPWFIFAKRYGEFLLKKNPKNRFSDYLYAEIEKAPKSAAGQETIGDFYFKMNIFDKAIDHYNLALTLSRENNTLLDKLAKTYLADNKKDEALATWKRIIAKDSVANFAFYFRALCQNGFVKEGKDVFVGYLKEGYPKKISLGILKEQLFTLKPYYQIESNDWSNLLKIFADKDPNNIEYYEFIISSNLLPSPRLEPFYTASIDILTKQTKELTEPIIDWTKRLANHYLKGKEYQAGYETICKLAIRFDPKNLPQWCILDKAKFLLKLKKEDEAMEQLTKIYRTCQTKENYLIAYNLLKVEGFSKKANEVLFEMYQFLLKEGDADRANYYGLAKIYLERGKKKEALSLLDEMIKAQVDNIEGLALAAKLCTEQKLFPEALKYRTSIKKIQPQDYENLFDEARLLSELNKSLEAMKILKKLLATPQVPNSIKDKIVEVLPATIPKANRKEEIQYFSSLIKGPAKTYYPYLILAELYFLENNPVQGLAVLKDGISHCILPAEIHLRIAKYYQQQKEISLATEHFKSALMYRVDDYRLNLALLEIYFKQKRYQLALGAARNSRLYPEYIDENSEDEDIDQNSEDIYRSSWEMDNYAEKIRQLAISNPQKIELLKMLAEASGGLENYAEAIFYEKVCQKWLLDEEKIKESEKRIEYYKARQKKEEMQKKKVIVYDLGNSN